MTTRANSKHRQICSKSFSPGADTPHIQLLQAPLECRRQLDPVSGALVASWVNASRRRASAEHSTNAPRHWRQPRLIADAARRSCCRIAAAGLVLGTLAQPAAAATIEIISRLLKNFAEQGWVRLGREQIEVLDATALRRLVSSAW